MTALPSRKPAFPIVGIGASAGGLESMEQFFRRMPADSGMAFAVVQHLDPTQKGLLPELLQRSTSMPVIQVKDRTRVRPNCVFVIPPNKDMSLLHGVLHLLKPVTPRGLRLPIDFFFRSLAADWKDRSIGVILSGMGTDGTLGIKAIKEMGGYVLVQEPQSAKFDGMPRSALDAGLADVTASAELLPEKIIAIQKNVPLLQKRGTTIESKTLSSIEKILILLRAQTGHDFSAYKSNTIYRRIERRMGIHQIGKITAYVHYLQENPQELDFLFKELLIGVTSFFRDPEAWEQLKDDVLPGLLSARRASPTLRAWVAGCSTGEEAYSLAIVFKEALEQIKPAAHLSLQIFATDLDREAVDKARQGFYPANIAADVKPDRLRRFFVKENHGFRVAKEIREMVIFAPQNLVMDPPFTKLDILSCRNLLIYISGDLQKKLMPLFHYSLNTGGILFLGSAESIGTFGSLFTPVKGKMRIYRRQDQALPGKPLEFPPSFTLSMDAPGRLKTDKVAPNIQALAEQVLLQRFAPASVLVTDKGDIVSISGRTGRYLEPASGKANWNIFAMARQGLRHEMNGAFLKTLKTHEPVTLHNLQVRADGGTQAADVTLQCLTEPEALHGMVMIVFRDVAAPADPPKAARRHTASAAQFQLTQVQQELVEAREELQSLREEMKISQEELRSSNEELQSTNEELQSTNEELTTSKEEMQSMNEELQTVNHEQQARVDELSQSNSDMKNLLNSTDIATIFLDNDLHLRRFTTQATKLINLTPTDAGRPITDITSSLLFPELPQDAQEVLRTLIPIDKQIVANDGRWYAARIMPYRTLENRIDGVTITFADITRSRQLEFMLRQDTVILRNMLDGIRDALFSLDPTLAVLYLNPAAERLAGRPKIELLHKPFFSVFPEANGSAFETRCRQALAQKSFASFETTFKAALSPGPFHVRIYPSQDGLSILLLERDPSTRGSGTP